MKKAIAILLVGLFCTTQANAGSLVPYWQRLTPEQLQNMNASCDRTGERAGGALKLMAGLIVGGGVLFLSGIPSDGMVTTAGGIFIVMAVVAATGLKEMSEGYNQYELQAMALELQSGREGTMTMQLHQMLAEKNIDERMAVLFLNALARKDLLCNEKNQTAENLADAYRAADPRYLDGLAHP